MKIKAIADICWKRQILYTAEDQEGRQWLGDGHAMYLIEGLPWLEKENIYSLFDYSQGKAMLVNYNRDDNLIPGHFNASDPVDIMTRWNLCMYKTKIIPFAVDEQLVLLNTAYLAPLGSQDDYAVYWSRSGQYFTAVTYDKMEGTEKTVAIIRPSNAQLITKDLVIWLAEMNMLASNELTRLELDERGRINRQYEQPEEDENYNIEEGD